MIYFTYVLLSGKDGKFYIGQTNNLKARLARHNLGSEKSTASRRPLKLVYFEGSLDLKDAIKREKYFKTGFGRRFLKSRLKNWIGSRKGL